MNLSRAKQAIGAVISHPLIGAALSRAYGGRIPFRGNIIDTRNAYIPPQSVAALRWGYYEKAELNFVRQYLCPDLDVVELGASIGVVTLEIIGKQLSHRKLVTVEANSHLLETARRNIATNSTRKDVEVVNAAIDYSGDTRVDFIVSMNNLISRTRLSRDQTGISVPATTLEEIVRTRGIERFAVVADIEGAEAGLLLHEGKILGQCQQVIIELHRTRWDGVEYSIATLAAILRERHGFEQIASHGAVFAFERNRPQSNGT